MTPKVIDTFDRDYEFLSNFYPCDVTYKGITYPSSEAAFHAQKTTDIYQQARFTTMTPSEAKRAGRKLDLRSDWEDIKYQIMYDIVLQKFVQNERLQKWLLNTEDAELIEGNWWGDKYWGVCHGIGQNNLGKILMDVRAYLRTVRDAIFVLPTPLDWNLDNAELKIN